MQIVGNNINGRTVLSNSGEFLSVINPTNREIIHTVTQRTYDEMRQAITSAHLSFSIWMAIAPLGCARFLFKFKVVIRDHRHKLATLISREHGKINSDTLAKLTQGIEVVKFACGILRLIKREYTSNVVTDIDCFSVMRSVGVIVGITHFNSPVMGAMWMFPITLSYNKSFVLSSPTTMYPASLRITELLNGAGLPNSVFNVIHCNNDVTSLLTRDDWIKTVNFVCSSRVVEYIYKKTRACEKHIRAFGTTKKAAIVMPDTDIDATLNAIMGGAFGSVGERCMVLLLFVAIGNDTAEKLSAKLKPLICSLRICTSNDNIQSKENEMRSIYPLSHQQRIVNYMDKGIAEGPELVIVGQDYQVDNYPNGFYVGGTLFDNVTRAMTIYKKEFSNLYWILYVQQISTVHTRLSMDMNLTVVVLFSHQMIILLVNLRNLLKLGWLAFMSQSCSGRILRF